MEFITDWFRRHIAYRQLVILIAVMISVGVVIYLAGEELAPVFAAVVIAYLLQGAVNRLVGYGIPQNVAFWIVFLAGMATAILLIFGLFPLLFREITNLVQ